MLTIHASFAQAEAQAVSENCRWRIHKNFEEGIPVTNMIYGFRMKNGKFSIVPKEAEIIREIFTMYRFKDYFRLGGLVGVIGVITAWTAIVMLYGL